MISSGEIQDRIAKAVHNAQKVRGEHDAPANAEQVAREVRQRVPVPATPKTPAKARR